MKFAGAIVVFNQAQFSGFYNHMDTWSLMELNFRRQIRRASRK